MDTHDGEVWAAARRDVGVGVDADEEVVALRARRRENLEVAKVENVEAAVDVDDARAGRSVARVGELDDPARRRQERREAAADVAAAAAAAVEIVARAERLEQVFVLRAGAPTLSTALPTRALVTEKGREGGRGL